MKISKALNKIQFVNWFVVCCLIFYSIFLNGKVNWFLSLKIGLAVQLAFLLINWVLGIRSNLKWAAYDVALIIMIAFVELANNGMIKTKVFHGQEGYAMVYLFILIVNLGFLFTIRQIRTEFKLLKLKKPPPMQAISHLNFKRARN